MNEDFDRSDHHGGKKFLPAVPSYHMPHPHRAAAAVQFAPDSATATITAGMVLNAISRWWKIALPTGLLLALTGAGIVWFLFEPKYESSALLKIPDQAPYIVFDGADRSKNFVATQIHLITRRPILAEALKQISRIPEIAEHQDPVAWLQSQLVVERAPGSELFEVKYQGRTPEGAKKVVDAIVDTYLGRTEQLDTYETREVIKLLQKEEQTKTQTVQSLREQVRAKTKQITGKDPYNPVGVSTLAINHPAQALMNTLVQSEVELQVQEARLQALEEKPPEQLVPSESALQQIVEADPEIVSLKRALTTVQAKMNQYAAATRDAEKTRAYARYQQEIRGYEEALSSLRNQLLDIRRQEALANAEQERARKLDELRSGVERYRLATDLLRSRFEDQVKELEQRGEQSLDLEFERAQLAREEKLLEMITDRTLQLTTELAAPGRVVVWDDEGANLPTQPVERAPWKALLVVTLVGLCAPFGLAIVWERTARRVGDATSLKMTELNVLAEVAALPARSAGGSYFGSERSKRDLSLFEESIDSLRTGLRLSRQLKDLHVLAVTSAVSREGKTSLASQLAVSVARSSGERTLLIDADMRAPNIHQVFDIPNKNGLSSVLSKECELNDAINTSYSDLLHLLPAGQLKASPHKLVGDGTFTEIVRELKQSYRFIVIDTPPVLSAGESLVLSSAADATMVCAMRNYSRAGQVREAYGRLQNADANPIGVVLNGVPVHRYSYAYGRYAYRR